MHHGFRGKFVQRQCISDYWIRCDCDASPVSTSTASTEKIDTPRLLKILLLLLLLHTSAINRTRQLRNTLLYY